MTATRDTVPPGAGETRAERIKRRVADLMANDRQVREAAPLAVTSEAKSRPGLGLGQIVATVMEAYADRPALGHRTRELVADPGTGRKSVRLLPAFETVSYRDVWSRARALAAVWHRDPAMQVRAGDSVCVLGFAGVDYVVVDLATMYLGAVMVPLQTNAASAQLRDIVAEVEPRCLAASIDSLDAAVDIILSGHHPASLIVFDYEEDDDGQAERYRAAEARLADAGLQAALATIDAVCERGAALPAAPLFDAAGDDGRLSTIYYTSGSTGSPKGAMYPERMVKGPWLVNHPIPLISLGYAPMNHSYGRSIISMVLGNGGTCYFTARSDLSALFEDMRLVRPTQIGFVPRLCEMVFQRYQGEIERRQIRQEDRTLLERTVMAEIRDEQLGGRILANLFGSAPLGPELRTFIEDCLDLPLNDGYGTTETAGLVANTRVLRPPVVDYKLVDVPELGYFRTDKPHPRGELVVKTTNIMSGYFKRPDATAAMFDVEGYYKTGDIMAEIAPDRLVYVDRRSNVLKLSQGEFVAIAKLEASYASSHPLIRQVYLYGRSDRAYLLAVVVPNAEMLAETGKRGDEAAVKALLRDAIKDIARAEQLNAYEVPRDFLVEHEAFSVENGLLAGVGKFLRPALKARYGARLDRLYDDLAANQDAELGDLRREGRHRPVLETVARAVQATLGIENVDPHTSHSFADLGGDSLSALSFSLLLEEIYEIEVPVGVITGPAGNLESLARYIELGRDGDLKRPSCVTVHGRGATEIHARDLTLEKFIDAPTLEKAKALPPPPDGPPRAVLLTGANGFLGRFLCLEWLERLSKSGGTVFCVARGEDDAAARRRIVQAFDSGDAELVQRFEALAGNHLEVLAGDVSAPNLGLSESDWHRLAETVDMIVHPAALVNHVLPYEQLFGPNVVGTAELIRLAITNRLKRFCNVSTVAAAILEDGRPTSEDADVRVACPSRSLAGKAYAAGYANSKWAGEVLLREAHERFGLPVTVFRSDMILAHSRYAGQLNVPDMFTRLLFSLVVTGLAPRSFYAEGTGDRAHYDGLPVDFTADAIADLGGRHTRGYRTYHVLNRHDDGISLDRFVDWIAEAGHAIQRVDAYEDWFARFETALRALPESQRQRSSLALLHQLRRPAPAVRGSWVPSERFHGDVRRHGIGPDKDIPHLSEAFIHKYLDDLKGLGLI